MTPQLVFLPDLGGIPLSRLPRTTYAAFRAPVGDLRFRIEAPSVEGALLRQLGPPPSWSLPVTPRDLLQPVVAGAAALARELALGGSAERPG